MIYALSEAEARVSQMYYMTKIMGVAVKDVDAVCGLLS
jgi:hypothetical protein